jgi:predicted metal-dependent phosphoesterase TrpH
MLAIDLHTHSSCSDGSLSPSQLVEEAARAGLAAIALTDHDTLTGVKEALAAGNEAGVEVISGIEISADLDGRDVHLLGYGADPDHPKLRALLAELQAARENRNAAILNRLDSQGIRLGRTELAASTAGLIGRPHIARQLVLHRHANSIDQAFRRFLGENGRAYVAGVKFTADETIRVIREAGGIAVLAHPTTLDQVLKGVPAIVEKLALGGLGGIEVYYPGHNRKICQALLELAERWQLVVTGGSDYHGSLKPDIKLGGAPVMPPIPYRLLTGLKERLAAGN